MLWGISRLENEEENISEFVNLAIENIQDETEKHPKRATTKHRASVYFEITSRN